jgi:MFS family permease
LREGASFRFFAGNRLLSASAQTLLQTAIAWQVWVLSHSYLQLGVLGLVRFIPALLSSLYAGALADAFDRRRITLIAEVAALGCAGALWAMAASGNASLTLIYLFTALAALAAAFENPARNAYLPQVVQLQNFPNAVTIVSTAQQIGFVVGPVLGGLLIGWVSVAAAYAGFLVAQLAAVAALLPVRPLNPPSGRRAVSLASIREGVAYVWRNQVLLGSMSLDMFAVIFGGIQAMLPVYATNILRVGARGYGVLASAQSIGALLMSFVMVALPPVRRAGRALLVAVTIFGLATIGFGVSHSYPLSLFLYMLTGMADQVSVIMRQTIVQLATPDELRGRVSAVSMLFISASNQVGAAESGLVAAITSAVFSVVSGGVGCLAVVAAVTGFAPELRRYDIAPTLKPATADSAPPPPAKALRRGRR